MPFPPSLPGKGYLPRWFRWEGDAAGGGPAMAGGDLPRAVMPPGSSLPPAGGTVPVGPVRTLPPDFVK